MKVGDERLTLEIKLPHSQWRTGKVVLSYFAVSDKMRCAIIIQKDRDDIEEYSDKLSKRGLNYMIFYPDCCIDLYCEQDINQENKDNFDVKTFFDKILEIIKFYKQL